MQSKVIRADYRHDNSSSMKKRLLRTKKTTEDRPTPADADSVPLVVISAFFTSTGGYISVQLDCTETTIRTVAQHRWRFRHFDLS